MDNITMQIVSGEVLSSDFKDFLLETPIELIEAEQKHDEEKAKVIYTNLNKDKGEISAKQATILQKKVMDIYIDDLEPPNLDEEQYSDNDDNIEEYINSMILNIDDGDIIYNIYANVYTETGSIIIK